MSPPDNVYLLYVVAVISLGTFQFGYNMAELNEPREAMSCPSASSIPTSSLSLPECIPMASWEYGLVTSIFAVGGLLGALGSGTLTNRYGRRKTLVLNSLAFVLAGICKAAAMSVPILAAGRFVSGLASGAAAVVVPLYLNEIAPPDGKGKFGAFTQISINIGILTTQLLGLFLSKPTFWRLILLTGALIGALQFTLLLSIPESPKYLLSTSNRSAAREALSRLRGRHNTIEDEIREEEPLTTPTPSPSASASISTYTFLTSPQHRYSMLVVCGLMAAQQFLGINAVVFHGVSILRTLLPSSAGAITVFISLANLIITSAASLFFDRISHKSLLLASMLGMATSAFALAAGMAAAVPALSAVACLCFVASFSVGLGPLPWMVAAKTVPYKAVDAAQASGLVVNWIGTFVVAFFVPLVEPVTAFVVFGCVGVVAAVGTKWGVREY